MAPRVDFSSRMGLISQMCSINTGMIPAITFELISLTVTVTTGLATPSATIELVDAIVVAEVIDLTDVHATGLTARPIQKPSED